MVENIEKQKLLAQGMEYVKSHFEGEGSGHDWWHIHRVREMALKIAEKEGGDLFLIEIAALFHDLDDWKLFGNQGGTVLKTRAWLQQQGMDGQGICQIEEIISQVSFKGAHVKVEAESLEAQIVQDADRLDAIGAIGIARAFAYGGSKNRLLHHPDIKPVMHGSFEAYKKTDAPTINHFYEKLLLLKDRMNTKTAQKIAQKRHGFMLQFLDEFYAEWDAKS